MADEGMFTEYELKALMHALARGQRRFSEEEIMLVVTWASELRVGKVLLEMALNGRLNLSVVDGEVRVCQPDKERVRD